MFQYNASGIKKGASEIGDAGDDEPVKNISGTNENGGFRNSALGGFLNSPPNSRKVRPVRLISFNIIVSKGRKVAL